MEATPSTSTGDSPRVNVRRSARVAAVEARERMTLTEEISSRSITQNIPVLPIHLFQYKKPEVHMLEYLLFVTVATIMNQVKALAKYGRVGWEGFEQPPPPSREDVLKEIEALDPNLKAVIEGWFFRNSTGI